MKNFILKINIVLTLFFAVVSCTYGFSGDLRMVANPDRYIKITLEAATIPFEGTTHPKEAYGQYNWRHEVQSGNIWRFYTNDVMMDQYNIAKIIWEGKRAGNIMDIAHCNGKEFPDENGAHGAWGFAKYKVTILVYNEDSTAYEKFMFYFNSLTSNFGETTRDWYFEFEEPTTSYNHGRINIKNKKVDEDPLLIDSIHTWDTLYHHYNYDEYRLKEVKTWLWSGGGGYQMNQFYARTTPFPVTPFVIDSCGLREFEVGTFVTLTQVYRNLGFSDRNGYNTVDTIDGLSLYKYYSDPPIPDRPVNNVTGKTLVTPAHTTSIKLTAKEGNVLAIEANMRFWISGSFSPFDHGDTVIFSPGSTLIMNKNSRLNTCRFGVLIDSGANKYLKDSTILRAYKFSSINFAGTQLNDTIKHSFVIIDSSAFLRLGDSTTLTFDGPNAKLILNPTSRVYLGKDAKIIFKNGASFSATNVTFSSAIANKSWDGIEINGSCAVDSIVNCKFYNAKNAIRIIGDESAAPYLKIIKNNLINVANDGIYGIYLENCIAFQCIGDTINTPYKYDGYPSCGIQAKVTINTIIYPEEVPDPSNIYAMQIIGNKFFGGNNSLVLTGFSDIIAPFYVYKNYFYNTTVGNNYIIGRMMTGIIKNNYFANSAVATAILLTQSTPDILENNINSESSVIYMNSSYPNLAPQILGNGQILWKGGKNFLNSMNYHSVYAESGLIYTDMGENSFTRNITSNNIKHITGHLTTNENIFYTRNNCWNSGALPNIMVMNNQNNLMTIDYSTINYSCIPSDQYSDFVLTDMGYMVYDTTFISNDQTGELPSQADIFYAQAVQNKKAEYYIDAILNYKALINNYPEFESLNPALYDLYECYERADTSRNQNVKDILYGDLKTFLNAKIQSGLYSADFNDIAYNIVLFCEAKMLNYTEALDGFEFIALFHPDPAIRLMASWDYTETQCNAGGHGGGIKEIDISKAKEIKKELSKRYKKFDRLIDKNPIMRMMKNMYKNEEAKRLDELNKSLEKEGVKGRDKTNKINTIKKDDEKINNRASMNLLTLNKLCKEQKEKQFIQDLMLNTNPEYNKDKIVKNDFNIPSEYALYQNYPNPFNPTTTIKYSIPQNSMVKLAVYDILGREISVLVNELQKAGNYSTILNASEFNLPSGVYFYRISAGNFSQTKRLVLLK